ncbi:glycosyltransferase [candidate division FCPU426 bacterium]|nr:glycosyltransferase [candidate division FCPU426 bacterium]
MHHPLVSILMPVFNAAAYLPACMESLRRQTHMPLEVVAVNDGSTDASGRLLADSAARDKRIKIITTKRLGLVSALNRGLHACQAKYVARMDADDICRLDRIEKQVLALQSDPSLTLVSCRTVSFPPANMAEGFLLYEQWLNSLLTAEAIEHNIFVESPFAHPTVMFCKAAVMSLGGYRDRGWPEDYDLWLRLYARNARFAKLPQTLLAWRMHEQRLSLRDPRYSSEAFLELKCEFLVPRLPGQIVVLGAGRTARAWIQVLQDRGIKIKAVLDLEPHRTGRMIPEVPIKPLENIRDYAGEFILAAVRKRGQREQARGFLAREGKREGADFLCVA